VPRSGAGLGAEPITQTLVVVDEMNLPVDEPMATGGDTPADLTADSSQPPVLPEVPAVPQRAELKASHEPTAPDSMSDTSGDDDRPSAAPIEETPPEPTGDRHWYILKVQSNREDSIRDALERRIKIAGLQGFFGEIIVPTETVTEFKAGKKRVVKRKLYPGYIVVNMEITEDSWFLVRETPGIGDFTGSGGKPSPMQASEVGRIVAKSEEKTDEAPKLKISCKHGDRVKINEGTFENFEGDVDTIDEQNGRVTVMINIFGRSTPVELEYWQIEAL
jgi:transcription termination/antitermination protein NusG